MTPREMADAFFEAERMQCNCDLDNWEPERDTGHSWVCRIHKAVKDVQSGKRPPPSAGAQERRE